MSDNDPNRPPRHFSLPTPDPLSPYRVKRFSLKGNGTLIETAPFSTMLVDSRDPAKWEAYVMCSNGAEKINGQSESRGKFDWVPADYVWNEEAHLWYPPNWGAEVEAEVEAVPIKKKARVIKTKKASGPSLPPAPPA